MQTTLHQLPSFRLCSINATKSQAMVVNLRLLQFDDACHILMDGNTIDFHQKVKNWGLIRISKLSWDYQISKICQNVFFTLKRLWPMLQFTPIQTRQKLVTSLIVSAILRERLKLAFNLCARYIYGTVYEISCVNDIYGEF
jgi:hypothetical protein